MEHLGHQVAAEAGHHAGGVGRLHAHHLRRVEMARHGTPRRLGRPRVEKRDVADVEVLSSGRKGSPAQRVGQLRQRRHLPGGSVAQREAKRVGVRHRQSGPVEHQPGERRRGGAPRPPGSPAAAERHRHDGGTPQPAHRGRNRPHAQHGGGERRAEKRPAEQARARPRPEHQAARQQQPDDRIDDEHQIAVDPSGVEGQPGADAVRVGVVEQEMAGQAAEGDEQKPTEARSRRLAAATTPVIPGHHGSGEQRCFDDNPEHRMGDAAMMVEIGEMPPEAGDGIDIGQIGRDQQRRQRQPRQAIKPRPAEAGADERVGQIVHAAAALRFGVTRGEPLEVDIFASASTLVARDGSSRRGFPQPRLGCGTSPPARSCASRGPCPAASSANAPA